MKLKLRKNRFFLQTFFEMWHFKGVMSRPSLDEKTARHGPNEKTARIGSLHRSCSASNIASGWSDSGSASRYENCSLVVGTI